MLHFLYVWFGLNNGSGAQYLFLSGIFSDITIFTGAIYAIHNIKKRSECHDPNCHKHGKYEFKDEINNVVYKLCEDHHPGVPKNVGHLHFAKIHKQQTEDKYEHGTE
jgi:hypothetical protein